MKYQIRVRWLAERDLEEAEDWYDEQRSGLGAEFRQTIDELFARLAANPQVYPRVHGEVRRAVLRRFLSRLLSHRGRQGHHPLCIAQHAES